MPKSKREALDLIRSISANLKSDADVLRQLPASAHSIAAADRLTAQVQHVVGQASEPVRVAFIGEQSTGKSSVLNDLLGTALAQGENGLDRFVTEILHPDIAPSWVAPESAGGIRFPMGAKSLSRKQILEGFFQRVRTSDEPSNFDDVAMLTVLHSNRWLRHLVFVNILPTPRE